MEYLRIVLFADTHLGFDLPARPRVERRRRGDDFFANYEQVLRHARESRPALLVHGGDFFHTSHVAPAVVGRAYEGLSSVADEGIPVVVAPGNHERSHLPQSIWLGHPGVHILDRPRTVVVKAGAARIAVGGFPFVRGDLRGAFAERLAESGLAATPAHARFLCIHQSVAGATVGPSGFAFRPGRDVVSKSSLPRQVTAVLAGHIHRAQVLAGVGHPPVYYPGSIERTSVAERDETKGFFDLTLTPGIRGDWGVVDSTFVPLPARPMVDLVLPAGLTPEGLETFLGRCVGRIDPHSVVRLAGSVGLEREVCRRVTAALLRSVFPPTMNVYLGRELARAGQ